MTTANYEGLVFKLSGLSLGASSTIPTGTALQQVVMTTRDLLAGATDALQTNDGISLTSGEAANILINGALVTATVPEFRAALLHTNTGTISVLIFTVGGNSYAMAPFNTNLTGITTTVAASTLNAGPATQINPLTYGLQPEDANTYTGQSFNTESSGSQLLSAQVGSAVLLDTDLIRGNATSPAQERIGAEPGTGFTTSIFLAAGNTLTESLTTLQFSDGSLLGAVKTLQSGGYSGYTTAFRYYFDQAALAASGHSLADVTAVLGSTSFDHNLSWADLGFTLRNGPAVNGGGDGVPPPVAPPVPTYINGTSGRDKLVGGSSVDGLRGFAGNDTLTGGGGADAFIFGTDRSDGRRNVDVVTDYTAGVDRIALEGGASVRSIIDNGSAIVITLNGDRDQIVINGAALTVADIDISTTANSFFFA